MSWLVLGELHAQSREQHVLGRGARLLGEEYPQTSLAEAELGEELGRGMTGTSLV